MVSYDWENLLISAVNGVLWNMLCITTPQPVSMQLVSVSGSGTSNVVFGMVHVYTHPSAPDRQQDKGSQISPESSASTHKNRALASRGSVGSRQQVLNICSSLKTLPSYKVSFFSHGSKESSRVSMVLRWCPWWSFSSHFIVWVWTC